MSKSQFSLLTFTTTRMSYTITCPNYIEQLLLILACGERASYTRLCATFRYQHTTVAGRPRASLCVATGSGNISNL